jgi:hypothetical protein
MANFPLSPPMISIKEPSNVFVRGRGAASILAHGSFWLSYAPIEIWEFTNASYQLIWKQSY